MENACVHIYHGDGKGKTTAALGLAVRAAGWGRRVVVAQFLKSRPCGELAALKALPGVEILRAAGSGKFTFQMNEEERRQAAAAQNELLRQAVQAAQSADLLVLDEALDAVRVGFVPLESLTDLLRARPAGLEVALTGRDPDPALLALADYVTCMKMEKHPYAHGLAARQGVEF